MAGVRRGGSPAGSPALSATPTGEGVGKVCVEVGCAGGRAQDPVRRRGALALCAPRDGGSPGGSEGALPSGRPEPHRPPTHAVPRAGTAAPLAPPAGSVSLGCTGTPPSPGGHPCPGQTPAGDRSRRGGGGGGTARGGRRGGRVAGGAQPRAPPRTLPALALPLPALGCCCPAARPPALRRRSLLAHTMKPLAGK